MTRMQRSYTMSRIRSQGNESTELRLARLFRANKINGWRRNSRLPGRPDFVFPKERVAVFVDGCFWHGCPKCALRSNTNRGYWSAKIVGNRQRDRRHSRTLRQAG